MSNFAYKGRDSGGQSVTGLQEGVNPGDVAGILRARGITPFSITQAAGGSAKQAGSGGIGAMQIFKQKILHEDVLMFSKQIYTLLKAGVPIMRALTGLQESSGNPTMQALLQQVRESLDSGRELSLALARHPKVFTPFYLSMVRVGEMTGRLEEVFVSLCRHMEFERFMREQVKSALRYPSFVMAAMGVALIVVNLFVIPAFAQVFKGFNTELPLMTRILLGFSAFTVNWWHVIAGALVAAVFAFKTWTGTTVGRYWWDKTKLSLPIAGKVVRKATLARFASSFALSSRSGVPIILALSNVAQTVDNAYIAKKVDGMREGIERGESVLRTARAANVFTPIVMQMIAVGEESGALDEMMEEIAALYQGEVEYELKTLAQQIEPIMITMLGVMVLILALGIFLPIWDLGKVAMKK